MMNDPGNKASKEARNEQRSLAPMQVEQQGERIRVLTFLLFCNELLALQEQTHSFSPGEGEIDRRCVDETFRDMTSRQKNISNNVSLEMRLTVHILNWQS